MTTVLDSDLAFSNLTAGEFTPSQFLLEGPFQSSTGSVDSVAYRKYMAMGLNANGFLVPLAPNALAPAPGAYAIGSVTVGVVADGNTAVINGATFTLVTDPGDVDAVHVLIEATPALTARALAEAINAANLGDITAENNDDSAVVNIRATVAGTAGNSLTLAVTGGMTRSAATLTGGDAAVEGAAPESKLYAILAQPTTAADNEVPIFIAGGFNHEMILWPAGIDTLAQRRAVCNGTKFWMPKIIGQAFGNVVP